MSDTEAKEVAPLVEYLSNIHKPLGSIPALDKLNMEHMRNSML